MIIAYLVLIPLLLLSLWLFFKYTPKRADARKVKIYNNSTLALAVIVSFTLSLTLRASMIHGSDAGWWPVLAFVFSLMISIGIIVLSAIIRNFIVFRDGR
jgi:hypothetical protein